MEAPDKLYIGLEDVGSRHRVYNVSVIPNGYDEYIRKDALLKYFHQRIEELGSPLNGVFGSTERDNCNERISELLLLIDKLNSL